jgi:hypothetical protein
LFKICFFIFAKDVKRWLADLRGKDMPETFAWSYKRYVSFLILKSSIFVIISKILIGN